ncbi:hypothetical protein WJX84_011417 [Apatococcus fuscideae]|uniref:DIS3-like exonuclease 1 n=1 Tax=Apatococcus fuscideae TaxID=2026836 RepID=A0AAW1TH71_9CHLO
MGTYRASRVPGEYGTVRAGSTAISIMNRQAANRALHGDSVAVRLLKRENRTRDNNILAAMAEADDVMHTSPTQEDSPEKITPPDASPEAMMGTAATDSGGGGGQPQGEVVAILQRSPQDIVACMSEPDERSLRDGASRTGVMYAALCLPMDRSYPQLRLSSRRLPDLIGQRFVVRIDDWPATSTYPNAHLLRVLGPLSDLRTEGEAILVSTGISHPAFSAAALGELPQVSDPRHWQVPAEEIPERRDLRSPDHLICSVDPPGCTDVDDALSVRFLGPDCIELGVHIADVSHFVHQGGSLDREAEARSTSVYLPDRRLDMLPRLLSEHLCSLNSNVDRLAVSVLWTLDSSFKLQEAWMGRTIIRSRHKLTYQQAQNLVDGAPVGDVVVADPEGLAALKANLQALCKFADHLRQGRLENGAMELESAELQFETSAEGEATGVKTKQELPMMRTVAELMIHANSTVAARIHAAFPRAALLRRHPPPRPEVFSEVEELCRAGGHPLDTSSPAALSKSLAAACAASTDASIASLVKSLATRAMSEAEYFSTGDVRPGGGGQGHFGLALAEYTHFTSPIRRYADIIVHRQLMTALQMESGSPIGPSQQDGDPSRRRVCVGTAPKAPAPQHRALVRTAEHVNERHRAAKKAQRDCQALHLLLLLHREPHVEPALIYAILPQQLLVFVPQFHIRGAIRLVDRTGLVLPLTLDASSQQPANDAFAVAARRKWRLEQDVSGSCRIVDGETGAEEASFEPMQKAKRSQSGKSSQAGYQDGGTASADAEDIQRMQRALAKSGVMEQHRKALAEGRGSRGPVARSLLSQAQQKQQAQALARAHPSATKPPGVQPLLHVTPPASSAADVALRESQPVESSPEEPCPLVASSGPAAADSAAEPAEEALADAHSPTAVHSSSRASPDRGANARPSPQRRSKEAAGPADSIAAAIASAWELVRHQVPKIQAAHLHEPDLPVQLWAGASDMQQPVQASIGASSSQAYPAQQQLQQLLWQV